MDLSSTRSALSVTGLAEGCELTWQEGWKKWKQVFGRIHLFGNHRLGHEASRNGAGAVQRKE